MIKSKPLFLLYLAYISHIVSNAAVTKSIDLSNSIDSVTFNSSSNVTSNPMNFNSPNYKQEYSLSIHLVNPVSLRFYNYGPGKLNL